MTTPDLAAANLAITDLYARIGRNIRTARNHRGATQGELARKVGLTRGSITNVEAGVQHPQIHMLIAIAQALETDVTVLLGSELPVLASATAGVDKLLRRLVSTRAQLDLVIADLEGKEAL